MHQDNTTGSRPAMARPRTAATTNPYDESRIKQKLMFLEAMDAKIEKDINEVVSNLDAYKIMSNKALQEANTKKGHRLTKKLVLEASMCDELHEVETLLLREKQIGIFDDNYEGPEE